MTAKEILRQRAAIFRNAAAQIEALIGMTPEVLTAEQENALMFVAQNGQFAF